MKFYVFSSLSVLAYIAGQPVPGGLSLGAEAGLSVGAGGLKLNGGASVSVREIAVEKMTSFLHIENTQKFTEFLTQCACSQKISQMESKSEFEAFLQKEKISIKEFQADGALPDIKPEDDKKKPGADGSKPGDSNIKPRDDQPPNDPKPGDNGKPEDKPPKDLKPGDKDTARDDKDKPKDDKKDREDSSDDNMDKHKDKDNKDKPEHSKDPEPDGANSQPGDKNMPPPPPANDSNIDPQPDGKDVPPPPPANDSNIDPQPDGNNTLPLSPPQFQNNTQIITIINQVTQITQITNINIVINIINNCMCEKFGDKCSEKRKKHHKHHKKPKYPKDGSNQIDAGSKAADANKPVDASDAGDVTPSPVPANDSSKISPQEPIPDFNNLPADLSKDQLEKIKKLIEDKLDDFLVPDMVRDELPANAVSPNGDILKPLPLPASNISPQEDGSSSIDPATPQPAADPATPGAQLPAIDPAAAPKDPLVAPQPAVMKKKCSVRRRL